MRLIKEAYSSVRDRRAGVATIAAFALIVSPIVLAAPALAAGTGYDGSPQDGHTWSDAHLAEMTVGVVYSDALTTSMEWDDREDPVSVTGDAPDGLTFEINPVNKFQVLVTGTPTNVLLNFDFTVVVPGTEGDSASLHFTGAVDPGLPATTTVASSPEIALVSSVDFGTSVTGASPTGQVQFTLGGTNAGSPVTLSSGKASYGGSVDASYSGTTANLVAVYAGDGANAGSTSSAVSVYFYRSPTVNGNVTTNGGAVSAATVDLISVGDTVAYKSTTTNASGEFSFDLSSEISTVAEASAMYLVRATLPDATVLYYNSAGTPDVTDPSLATSTGPSVWTSASLELKHSVPPVWADVVLANPREASAYSDFVTASGSPAPTYSLVTGALPTGVSLNTTTGEVSGTPGVGTEGQVFNFTITAANTYGSVDHAFTLTVGAAGIAPTWVDDAIGSLQVSTPFTDAVTAVGDPVISYRVSAGAIPAGLNLNSATGAITGTPAAAGSYDVTVEASNSFGLITTHLTGTVAAAPELALNLNFAAGTALGDASTKISADGLQVGSTYTLNMYSTPTLLYTGTIGASGGFAWTVSLPANTPAGAHKLVLTGVAPDGRTMTATAWFTLGANGKILQISYTGATAGLALTGTDSVGISAVATSLLGLGVLLVVVVRRQHGAQRRRLRAE